MPMLRITVTENGTRLHGDDAPVLPALAGALAADTGPVTIMVHGYKYQPGHPVHCPHASLMSPAPHAEDRRVVSWPARLGLQDRVAISFGWQARGSIWAAHRRAALAGEALAALVREIRRLAPRRPVNVIAHSLGARVALAQDLSAPCSVYSGSMQFAPNAGQHTTIQ